MSARDKLCLNRASKKTVEWDSKVITPGTRNFTLLPFSMAALSMSGHTANPTQRHRLIIISFHHSFFSRLSNSREGSS